MSSSTIRNGIIATVLILIAGSVFGLMVYQVVAEGAQLTEQVAALEAERAQEASYLRLQRQAELTTDERSQLQSHFLQQEGDSVDFLNQVEQLAPTAGVVLETSGLDLLTDPLDESEWITVTFTFSGSQMAVQRFIKILETLPYVQQVTAVTLTAHSGTNWQAELTMQVRLLTYDTE